MFADDATAAGNLRQFFSGVTTTGPEFGYYPNARKSHLIVKPELADEVKKMFKNTNVQISTNR